MSPTCILPALVSLAPTQTISTVVPFIINIIAGIIIAITLFTNRLVFVRVLFASSNLSFSWSSRLNALITGRPVRISLETRFTLSMSF